MCVLTPPLQMRGPGLGRQKTWPRARSMFLQEELGCSFSEDHGSSFSSPEQMRARGKTSVCPGAILPHVLCYPLIPPSPQLGT